MIDYDAPFATRRAILTYTPGYAFFVDPKCWGAFEIDVLRFARLIRDELEPLPTCLLTRPSAADVRQLLNEPIVAVDIETAPETRDTSWTGKDPTRAKLRTVGLGTTVWALSHKWGDDPEVEQAIQEVLEAPQVRKVFQNGSFFDVRVLGRYGLHCVSFDDTRDARRAISATSRLALGHLGSLYTDYFAWKEADEDDEKGLVFTDDYEKLKTYNAHDCVVTARVWRGLVTEADWTSERVQGLYVLHRELARITAEMHTTGICVDEEARQFISFCLRQQAEEAREKLTAAVDMPAFNGTPDAFRSLIFRRHETAEVKRFSLPDPTDPKMYTDEIKRDCIAVNKDALLTLLVDPTTPDELKRLIDMYWAVSQPEKQRSTFIDSELVLQAIGADGRLRPGWNSCGTDTGRFSCSAPNVMNLRQICRHMYRAGHGNTLVHGDFSQLEIRVMAYVAQDLTLERFLASGDVYAEEAKAFFPQIPRDAVKCPGKDGTPPCLGKPCTDPKHVPGPMRQAAKIIRLAYQYAAGDDTAYRQAIKMDRKMKFSAVRMLGKKWKETFSATVRYWWAEMARVKECGYSESRICGRRRTYPREPRINEVVNYPIQATAADIANLTLVRLDAALKRNVPSARIIIQLHDAFDVECAERDAPTVTRILEDEMTRPVVILGLQRSFPVEIKCAQSWGDV